MMTVYEPNTPRLADASPRAVRPVGCRLQHRVAAAILLCGAGLLVSAEPATPDAMPASAEDAPQATENPQASGDAKTRALTERVRARWAAKLERDFKTVYGFETPEYRASRSAEIFAGRFGNLVEWHGVAVGPIAYDDDGVASVKVDVDHTVRAPFDAGDIRQIITMVERWKQVDGTWYHVIESRSPIATAREANPTADEREVEDDTDTN